RAVATPDRVLEARVLLDEIHVDELARRYVLDLVFATREPRAVGLEELAPLILYGASPRASIAMTLAARANAFLEGRSYVSPADIQAVGLQVLRHRVIPTFEAEAKGVTSDDIVRKVFATIAIP
ncbi:MAG TPA: MoxR family ATPase, partial [Planctomycetota bacterium]|nr:MoxR family ATPase [Planctomycetota bacterium]